MFAGTKEKAKGGSPSASASARERRRLRLRLRSPPVGAVGVGGARRAPAAAAVASLLIFAVAALRAADGFSAKSRRFGRPPAPPPPSSFLSSPFEERGRSEACPRPSRGARLCGKADADAAATADGDGDGDEDENEREEEEGGGDSGDGGGGGGGIFYDDFGDFVAGSSDSAADAPSDGGRGGEGADAAAVAPPADGPDDAAAGSSSSESSSGLDDDPGLWSETLLRSRVAEARSNESLRAARLAKNWGTGNWAVRGFALDESDPVADARAEARAGGEGGESAGEDGARTAAAPRLGGGGPREGAETSEPSPSPPRPIHVSKLAMDVEHESDVVAAGRTDGTVCLVRLGTEYLTKFAAVPKLVVDDDKDGWGRDDGNGGGNGDNGGGNGEGTGPGDNDSIEGGGGATVRVETQLVNSDEVRDQLKELRDVQAGLSEDPFSDYDVPPPPPPDDEKEEEDARGSPFRLLRQFRAHDAADGPVSALLLREGTLYTASGNTGEVRAWEVTDDEEEAIPVRTLAGVHSGGIVALKTLSSSRRLSSPSGGDDGDEADHDLLLSASLDGTFALWSLDSGDLVRACRVVVDDDDEDDQEGEGGGNSSSGSTSTTPRVSILCADVDTSSDGAAAAMGGHVVYLGLSTGHVVGYVAPDLVEATGGEGGPCRVLQPACKFVAHGRDTGGAAGTTSVLCAGGGTMGPNTGCLVTGGANGSVKQWEMMARRFPSPSDSSSFSASSPAPTKLEHWPRLPTQRLKGRAHLFGPPCHSGPVTALASSYRGEEGGNARGGPPRVLSAGTDGTVRVWDPQDGAELYRLDGFVSAEDIDDAADGGADEGVARRRAGVSSLCVGEDVLLTDGMGGLVCLHDFDIAEEEAEDGRELEW